MRHSVILTAIITLSLSNHAFAFGDEPLIPTAQGSAQTAEKAKEPTLLDVVNKFEKGKTSLDEAKAKLGEPDSVLTMPDDSTRYQFSHGHFFGKSYGAVLIFDKNNILKEKMTVQF
jgi:hypothetical protein